METILIKDTATTVTYDNDCIIPGTEYGERVPVQVEIDTTYIDKADQCITIVIGEYRFLPEEIQKWQNMIDRAKLVAQSLKYNV